jgi:phosphoribosylformylglycinamidine synthase
MTRALVLRTAGTNCDRETVLALEMAGARTDLVHLHRIVREPALLDDYAILVIAGGFSYGDDVAAGRVFGHEMRHALTGALNAFVARGGLVLGVCNGFQVLLETGLLEGAGPDAQSPDQRSIALTGNESARFECRWVTLRSEDCACPWLESGELLPMPAAHAEGRFLTAGQDVIERLRRNGQIALRYAPAPGRESEVAANGAGYPDCPNGSVEAIAGICDPTGRVLGLMPHPERNITPWHHPHWTRLGARSEGEGLKFYRRMVQVASGSGS